MCFHLHLGSSSLQLNLSCSALGAPEQNSVEMLSLYLLSFLFQRGPDELFTTCVTNGPFIMNNNSSSAGNVAFTQLQFVSAANTARRSGFPT